MILSAQTGERALLVLRERRDAIDWLVTRQALPGLVDGPMLADEYHIHHAARPVLIGGGTKESASGTIALSEPVSPDDIVSRLRALSAALHTPTPIEAGGQALAA